MAHTNDNPNDHAHSDYIWPAFPGLVAIFIACFTLVMALAQGCDVTKHEDRIDKIECRIAADETACLRDKLDDQR